MRMFSAISFCVIFSILNLGCTSSKKRVKITGDSLVSEDVVNKLEVNKEIRCQAVEVSSQNTGSLIEFKPLSEKLVMLIPASFKPMGAEILAVKYPMKGRRPTEVYTNEAGSINIALNHTQSRATTTELPQIKRVLEQQFSHPTIEFISSEIRIINSMECVIIEFVSPAVDTRVYNLMYVTSLDNRLMISTFNCTVAQRSEWEWIGKEIVNSIRLN